MTSEVKLKTGGDPRSLPDYAALSDIVRDLSRLGWMDERIGTELGMDQDEVLRLKQISGLTELFQEEDFNPAWTVR